MFSYLLLYSIILTTKNGPLSGIQEPLVNMTNSTALGKALHMFVSETLRIPVSYTS